MIKVLNLYAGIGGNRKLWRDVEVTSVEYDQEIANIYQTFFPDDKVVVGDAHQYLLDHYRDFDFIWSSPPCPTHSRIREMGVKRNIYPAVYPDISLWQEITLLKHFAGKTKWVVENVQLYYEPIIQPSFKLDRHFFWSNFRVKKNKFKERGTPHKNITKDSTIFGVNLSDFKVRDKKKLLRNMVNPEAGLYILDAARGCETVGKQQRLF